MKLNIYSFVRDSIVLINYTYYIVKQLSQLSQFIHFHEAAWCKCQDIFKMYLAKRTNKCCYMNVGFLCSPYEH